MPRGWLPDVVRCPLPVVVAAAVAAGSCAPRAAAPATQAEPPAAVTTAAAHENLNAVLWMQTALEYEATARQAYALARLQLDAALKDPAWSAAVEQTGNPSKLPPAVIVDIDETVLDNSFFQARTVRDNVPYSEDIWNRWVQEARAPAIPGAREFAQYAAGKGITIFYISNRMSTVEAPTRANLAAQGFPLDDAIDTVLTRGERPEWQPSGKGPRRAHVARSYRILLLVGDDLGDFVVNASGSPEERQQRTEPNSEWWGRRWIMLPNPTYGSWERALIGSSADPLAAKRRALRYEPR